MIGLDQTLDIYTAAASGAYTVAGTAGVACRLALVPTDTTPTGTDRAELASTRRLLWDAAVTLAETAQVEVDSVRWNVVPGTLAAVRGPNGSVIYRRCDVVRAV